MKSKSGRGDVLAAFSIDAKFFGQRSPRLILGWLPASRSRQFAGIDASLTVRVVRFTLLAGRSSFRHHRYEPIAFLYCYRTVVGVFVDAGFFESSA